VSHDRALLDAVGSRTIALEDRRLHSYVGGWPEYVRVREERAGAAAAKPVPRPKRAARPRPAGRSKPAGDPEKLEKQIEVAEAALRALEDELADPAAWATPRKSADSTARHERAKRAIDELYSRWEATAG
jgi:ATP-binding cassette subfamily F protein 3